MDISIAGIDSMAFVDESYEITLRATSAGKAIANYAIDTWANGARITPSTVVTDGNGEARVTLYTPPAPANIELKAMSGLQQPIVLPVSVDRKSVV